MQLGWQGAIRSNPGVLTSSHAATAERSIRALGLYTRRVSNWVRFPCVDDGAKSCFRLEDRVGVGDDNVRGLESAGRVTSQPKQMGGGGMKVFTVSQEE